MSWFPWTHWGPDKMAVISQMTFSRAFSWMKMFAFRLNWNQIMAWCWWGNKPMSEPMMIRLQTRMRVTRLQWVEMSVNGVPRFWSGKLPWILCHYVSPHSLLSITCSNHLCCRIGYKVSKQYLLNYTIYEIWTVYWLVWHGILWGYHSTNNKDGANTKH